MLPFHQPALSELERNYVLEALEERWWGGGAWVERLEAAMTRLWQRPAVAVHSGTAALELALRILLRQAPGEVIVPVWTFTASAAAIYHAGGQIRLADVGPTLHLTPDTLLAAWTPRTRGLIVVHYAGEPAPMEELLAIARAKGLWVLEDACHALPSYLAGRLCGTFGEAAAFSFHATKPVAAGQGGAILFADPEKASLAKSLRAHGILRSDQAYWDYEVVELGWNYQLSSVVAALALAQLERQAELWQKRRALAQLYRTHLQEVPGLRLYPVRVPDQVSWHLFPVFVEGGASRRDAILTKMRALGFPLNLHYRPLHRHAAYAAWATGQRFPQADEAYEQIITLPIWPDMSAEAAATLLEAFIRVLRSA